MRIVVEKSCKRCGKTADRTLKDDEDDVSWRPYGLDDGSVIYFCSRACYRKWAEKRNKENK
jgi:hypothetical protein